jgi:hypothetical protein
LSELGLLPGTRFYLRGVKVTKQKGFGTFNVAAYWKPKYRDKAEAEGWYLLTNLEDLHQSITAFLVFSSPLFWLFAFFQQALNSA